MSLKRRWLIAVLLLALLGTGLTAAAPAILRSPEMRKARHLQRGDHYFSEQKYREASIEYRNVLQVEAGNVRAIQQLALAYYQLGDVSHAVAYLLKWRERDPDSPDARLKLGTISLISGPIGKGHQGAAA